MRSETALGTVVAVHNPTLVPGRAVNADSRPEMGHFHTLAAQALASVWL